MRRNEFVVLIAWALLVQACGSLLPPANTPTPTATFTNTPVPTATATKTKTPRPSPTVTIVRIPTFDPFQPTNTVQPIEVLVGSNVIATQPSVNLTPESYRPGAGFISVIVSENKIFWGSCKHNKTMITAIVEDEDEVFSVVIFTRVKEAGKEDYTPWTRGNVMHDHRDGTYTYVMYGSEVEGHNHYKNSYVFFQLVAVNIDGEEVGRTQIFTESIFLSPCE